MVFCDKGIDIWGKPDILGREVLGTPNYHLYYFLSSASVLVLLETYTLIWAEQWN